MNRGRNWAKSLTAGDGSFILNTAWSGGEALRAGRKSTHALTFPHPWGKFRNGTCVPSRAL
jgi:hypothetical protein